MSDHVLGERFDGLRIQGLRAAALVELALLETLGLAFELGVCPGWSEWGPATAAASSSAAGRSASHHCGPGTASGLLLLGRRRRRCSRTVGGLTLPATGSSPSDLLCRGYLCLHSVGGEDLLCLGAARCVVS